MSETQNWQVRKPAARSRRGIVASQHRLAAEVGAEMLAAGGKRGRCRGRRRDELRTGERFGMSDVMSPWSGAAAEKER